MSNRLRLAVHRASGDLFKLLPYDTPTRQTWAEDLLRGYAYFPLLSEFNDPFEGKLRLTDDDRASFVKRLGKAVLRIGKQRGESVSNRLAQAERRRRQASKGQDELIERITRRHHQRLESEVRLFCLSGTRAAPLLWSHYSNKHAGICVHFNSNMLPFAGAIEVTYDETFPASPLLADRGSEPDAQLFVASLLTKAKFWEYEQEYRLVSSRMANEDWDLGLSWDAEQKVAQFNPDAITGLTLGVRISPEARARIVSFCRAHRPALQLEQAKLRDGRYELAFEALPP